MSLTLENTFLRLTLHPELSTFSVESRGLAGPFIRHARLGVKYRCGRRRELSLNQWRPLDILQPQIASSPHGPLRQLAMRIGPDRFGLTFTVTFALSSGGSDSPHPLLLWKLEAHNQGRKPVFMEHIELLQVGFIPISITHGGRGHPVGSLYPHSEVGELAFFSNGWGSWNDTRTYGYHDYFQRTRLGPFTRPMRVNPGTPHPLQRGHFGSDMFGVLGDRTHRTAILVGFLSQRQHFGSLEVLADPLAPALSLSANGDDARLDPGAAFSTDWACLLFFHLDTADPLAPYLEAVAREHGLDLAHLRESPTPTGWCSWYHYFQNISAETIRQNLQTAVSLRHSLPLQIIQIDDGYQSQVGDWLSFKETFPEGPAPLAAEIRAAGFTPGLWLAPFVAHPRARLVAEHPDWLLRSRWGLPVSAGFLWNTFARALDLTRPAALDHVRQVIHTAVHRWGFPYLKLDFLYAAALKGRYHDPTRTRAQVLRRALQTIRQAAGEDTFLLACGCPLGSAIGLFDAMRVSADVAPHWHPQYAGKRFFFHREPDFPSVRNATHNSLTRASLHRRWWINDPDCLLLRPETDLTLPEVHTLATVIALTGGSLLLSDDLTRLPPDRLRIVQALLPPIGQRPHLLDWFDNPTPTRLQLTLHGAVGTWHLVALFNWEEETRDLVLRPQDFYLDPQKTYLARDFWRGETRLLSEGVLPLKGVPPHGCVLLALRPVRPYPQYLGSDLHISQGLEVTQWETNEHTLDFSLTRPGGAQGVVELQLPAPPETASLNGVPLSWQPSAPGCYRFPVRFEHTARLSIRC